MVILQNINKSFNEDQILFDISIDFEPGKTNLIIGKSGSGKTVLMKSIIGLHIVDSGKIFYDNRNFVAMNHKEQRSLRKEMGMLFQGSALFDSFTVEENIKFPLDMFSSMTEKEKKDRVNFCLNRVNLENVNKLFPGEISGGMQKRVAIARAIVLNPRYLFCDEPNSGLDPKTALVIDKLISDITHEYNMTTIVNTHDMNSVMEIGEKVVFIHNGRKCWEGTNVEIMNSDDEALNDFIFASDFAKRVKESNIDQSSS
jgi:phospholipid/cholesterol/gamma-HCH transport system ATP-binding protein